MKLTLTKIGQNVGENSIFHWLSKINSTAARPSSEVG